MRPDAGYTANSLPRLVLAATGIRNRVRWVRIRGRVLAVGVALVAMAGFASSSRAVGLPEIPSASTYVTNGAVDAVAVDSSGGVYLGGSFTEIGPRLGRGISLSTSDDQPATGWPDVNGPVLAVVSDGSGGWFIGGQFTYVGGLARNGLAHIDSDGAVDPSWNPDPAGSEVRVEALALSGSELFVGGVFSSIGGQSRDSLAEVSASGSGAADQSWDPDPSCPSVGVCVDALAVSGSDLFVGGAFSAIGGQSLSYLAQLSTSGAGAADPAWDPDPNSGVLSLLVSGSELFVGGNFTTIGGESRSSIAELSTQGDGAADPTWNPSPNRPSMVGDGVYTMALSGTSLFVGGVFGSIGGQSRNDLAELSTTGTGAADPDWNPAGTYNPGVNTLVVSGGQLYVGGQFSQLGGISQSNLVRLSLSGAGAADASWNPNVNGVVDALGAAGSELYAGGEFTSAGSLNAHRGYLVRLNPDGTLDQSWNPGLAGVVNALTVVGGELYVGGGFLYGAGGTQHGIARISTATGQVDTQWDPDLGLAVEVFALAVSGTDVYVGGTINLQGLLARVGTADGSQPDPDWDPDPNGTVYSLAVSGSNLYVGGGFTTIGGQQRYWLARVPTSGDGSADPTWDPNPTGAQNGGVGALAVSGDNLYVGGGFSSLGGEDDQALAEVSLTGTGAVNPTWNAAISGNVGVGALAVLGPDLYAGGGFEGIGGTNSNFLAALPLAGSGSADPSWNPAPNNGVEAVATSGNGLVIGGGFSSVGPLSTEGVAVFGDISVPQVTLTTPNNGARYELGQRVVASYACSDPSGVVGIASCAGPVASGQSIDTATAGQHSFTVTATDAEGNSSSQIATYTVLAKAPPPSNRFTILRPFRAERGGAAMLIRIKVPGKGTLSATQCAQQGRHDRCRKMRHPSVSRGRLSVARARTATLRLTLTRRGLRSWRERGRLEARLQVVYTPAGGSEATKMIDVSFVAKRSRRKGR